MDSERHEPGGLPMPLEGIAVEAERARRFEAHLSVLLINVDGLGLVNRNLGNECGDRVLSDLASVIRANIRKIDVFGRWAVEDFVILTVDRNSFGSIALAEKLRRTISDHSFECAGNEVRLTVSIGVSRGVPSGENEIDSLMASARNAVLRAKSKGRNRVEYCEGFDGAVVPAEP